MSRIINYIISFYDLVLYYLLIFGDMFIIKKSNEENEIIYNLDYDRLMINTTNLKLSLDRKENINMKDFNNYIKSFNDSFSSEILSLKILLDKKEIDITSDANKILKVRDVFKIKNNTTLIDLIPNNHLSNKITHITLMDSMFDEHKLDFPLNKTENIKKYFS
jgi:hypothetical protein